jgi:hypothetical protein
VNLLQILLQQSLLSYLTHIFNRFRTWDHTVSAEDQNTLPRRYKSIIGENKPCPVDYLVSLTSYLFTQGYKDRLDHCTELVRTKMECKSRTARNYGFVMAMVWLIFDEFPAELASLNMSWESFER